MRQTKMVTSYVVFTSRSPSGVQCTDADQVAEVLERLGDEDSTVRQTTTTTIVETATIAAADFMGETLEREA